MEADSHDSGHTLTDLNEQADRAMTLFEITPDAALYFMQQEGPHIMDETLAAPEVMQVQQDSNNRDVSLSTIFEEANEPTIAPFLSSSADRYDVDTQLGPVAKRPRLEYRCIPCNTTFTERRTLLRHQRSPAHCAKLGLVAQKYCCQICQKAFTRNDLRMRHVREVHDQVKRTDPISNMVPHAEQHTDQQSALTANDEPASLLSETDVPEPSKCHYHEDVSVAEHGTLHTQPSCRSVRSCGSQELEAQSTASSSKKSEESAKSLWHIALPFRSGSSSDGSTLVNPRPFALQQIKPCPICGKEFGTNGAKVKRHIDNHLDQLGHAKSKLQCSKCRLSFVHAKDLEWHSQCAASGDSCGFAFAHTTRCSGHHPPGNVDHASFQKSIWHWEYRQLQEFSAYVDDHAAGLAPTNAPAYNQPDRRRFRMSTGSLVSTTAQSYFSWLSAPGPGGYKTRVASARSERPTIPETPDAPPGINALTIYEAIDGEQEARTKLLSAAHLNFNSEQDFRDAVVYALGRLDHQILELLSHSVSSGEAFRQGKRYPFSPCPIMLTKEELLHLQEIVAHVAFSEQIDFRFMQDCTTKLTLGQASIEVDWVYIAWFCERNLTDRLGRILFEDRDFDISRGMVEFLTSRRAKPRSHELLNQIVQTFLDHGASVHLPDSRGITPLMQAAKCNSHELCAIFLDRGADPHALNFDHQNVIHILAEPGLTRSMSRLMDRSVDMSVRDHWELTPLAHAIQNNSIDAARVLLSHGAEMDIQCVLHLCRLVPTDNFSMLRKLLNIDGLFEDNVHWDRDALIRAVAEGRTIDTIALILQWSACTHDEMRERQILSIIWRIDAIDSASLFDNAHAERLLLDDSVIVERDSIGRTFLVEICEMEGAHWEAAIIKLLESGADVNAAGGRYGCAVNAIAHQFDERPDSDRLRDAMLALLSHGACLDLHCPKCGGVCRKAQFCSRRLESARTFLGSSHAA